MKPQPKPHTPRDPAYLAFIRKQPCCVCGKQSVAHHVQSGGIGIKSSDRVSVPLCDPFGHHTELHRIGKKTFSIKYNIDLLSLAKQYFDRYNQASN